MPEELTIQQKADILDSASANGGWMRIVDGVIEIRYYNEKETKFVLTALPVSEAIIPAISERLPIIMDTMREDAVKILKKDRSDPDGQ